MKLLILSCTYKPQGSYNRCAEWRRYCGQIAWLNKYYLFIQIGRHRADFCVLISRTNACIIKKHPFPKCFRCTARENALMNKSVPRAGVSLFANTGETCGGYLIIYVQLVPISGRNYSMYY